MEKEREISEVIEKKNAEHYVWGGICEGWHLLKTPGLSVIEERVPPGRSEVRHYHRQAHQFFYVLAGKATLEVGDRVLQVKPFQGVSVPAMVPHKLSNRQDEDLIFLVTSAPMSHGDRVAVEEKA